MVDDGVDRVLVWGGDGTVRRCIDTIVGDGLDHVSVGILPAGTANLLAKNLNIPIDLEGAVDIALHGEPRAIDVGVMNGEHFAVMGGTGFDALMIKDADDNQLKEQVRPRRLRPRHDPQHEDGTGQGDASSSTAESGSPARQPACSSATSARSSVGSRRSPTHRPPTVGSTSVSSRPSHGPTGFASPHGA